MVHKDLAHEQPADGGRKEGARDRRPVVPPWKTESRDGRGLGLAG